MITTSLNTRGQGMSTNTIILLILGLIILGVLIFGFTTGWNAFRAEVGKTNVDQVVEECSTTCSLSQEFSFCSGDKELRVQPEKLHYRTSCGVYSAVPEFARFDVGSCPRITCEVPCELVRINDMTGEKMSEVPEGYHDVSDFANDVGDGEFCVILENKL